MIEYQDVVTRRVVKRYKPDKWLEASAGWIRLGEPAPAPKPETWDEPALASTEDSGSTDPDQNGDIDPEEED